MLVWSSSLSFFNQPEPTPTGPLRGAEMQSSVSGMRCSRLGQSNCDNKRAVPAWSGNSVFVKQ